MKRVQLNFGTQVHCEILVGHAFLDRVAVLRPLLRRLKSKKVFLIVDRRLASVGARFVKLLKAEGFDAQQMLVSGGESLKKFENIYPLYGKLLKADADRQSTLFAMGGGSVGDAVGFVASTYLRGIDWVGVPTTLLSQVDSAVGGKTGINHEMGKNLIGSFHQPKFVLVDTAQLKTLSMRDRVSGLAEIVKMGLILDAKFFAFLEKNLHRILALDASPLNHAVATSIAWKAKVVQADERDLAGSRELLNFGHTLGHALESSLPKHFRHGEAVVLGMRAAAALSVSDSSLSELEFRRIERICARLHTPKIPDDVRDRNILQKLRFDKKNSNQKLRFVLLKAIGRAVSKSNVSPKNVRDCLWLIRGAI